MRAALVLFLAPGLLLLVLALAGATLGSAWPADAALAVGLAVLAGALITLWLARPELAARAAARLEDLRDRLANDHPMAYLALMAATSTATLGLLFWAVLS